MKEYKSKDKMDKCRNYKKVKCVRCGNNIMFNPKDGVDVNELGQRVVTCEVCNRETVLRKY